MLDAVVLAVVGIVGTYAGSLASAAVPAAVLVVLLARLLAVVGGLMVRQTPGGADDDPDVAIATGEAASGASGALGVVGASGNTASSGSTARRLGPIAAVGVGVGLLTGFFGVGGGFAIVPALTLVLGYSMRAAIGTSLLVIALNSATALAARLVQGASLDLSLIHI